jgi:hypothetical protein
MEVFKSTTKIQAILKKTFQLFSWDPLEKSEIATQFAAITDELNQMYDIDEDVTPVDEDGNNLPNKNHLEDDEESHVSVDCPTMMKEDSNNGFDYEDEEDFPPVLIDKFSGIPRFNRNFTTI